jgi:RHS repeat-associated protein
MLTFSRIVVALLRTLGPCQPRLCRVVVGALVLAGAIGATPRLAHAQPPPPACSPPNCPIYPPIVTVTPSGGTLTQSLQTVTIDMCDTLSLRLQAVTFNTANVLAQFPVVPASPHGGCSMHLTATGNVLLTPGTNTLLATVAGGEAAQQDTITSQTTYTFTLPPIDGVTVIAATGHINALASTAASAGFTVTNTGSATDTFTVVAACRGSGLATCGAASPASTILASGATQAVSVAYTMGATASATGTIQVNAHRTNAPTTVADSGWTDVTVQTKSAHGVVVLAYNPNSLRDPGHCLDVAVRPGLAVTCGDLRFVHELPSVRTYDKVRTPALIYESQGAHPYILSTALVTADTSVGTIDSVVVKLHSGGVTVDHVNLPASAFAHGVTERTVLGEDLLSAGSSEVTYVVVATTYGHSGTTTTDSTTGFTAFQNSRFSNAGRGWMVAGLEHLQFYGTPPTGSLLWTTGGGDIRYYQPVSGKVDYWTTQQLDRVDTITYNTTTKQYTRLAPHRVQVVFDSLGRHIQTIDRLGYTTVFAYRTTSATSVDVDHITVPSNVSGGLTYHFVYNTTSGYLDAVQSPGTAGVRIDSLYRDGNNQVVKLVYPNHTSETLAYSSAGNQTSLISALEDRRGMWTTIHYDTALKVKQVAIDTAGLSGAGALNLTTLLTAQQSVGYHVALNPDSAYSIVNGPRFDTTITRIWLDQFGSPVRVRNALGNETLLTKGNSAFPALVTREKSANQRVVGATYDSRGNIASETDSSHVMGGVYETTRYTFDQKWDFVTNIARADTDSVSFAYDATFGNRQWEEPEGDTTRQVRFSYWASGTPAANLLFSVATPLQRAAATSTKVYYDSLKVDDSTEVTPKGFLTEFVVDAVGRRIRSQSQLDSTLPTPKYWRVDSTAYDSLDRVVLTKSYGPRDSSLFKPSVSSWAQGSPTYAPAETLTVTTAYSSPGRMVQDTVTRRASPDANAIGAMATSWVYDAADRVQQETAPDGYADHYTRNASGDVVSHTTRRNHILTMAYDSLNRLIRTVVPSLTYDSGSLTIGSLVRVTPLYSNCAAGNYCTAADTAALAYDEVGNLIAANNVDARITRAYNPNGTLAADTLRIRTYTGTGDFTNHVYGVGYTYDLDNRRTSLTHPGVLAPYTGGVLYNQELYSYNHLNQLQNVNDVLGNYFNHTYDLDGRLYRVATMGTVETKTFDGDDQMIALADSAMDISGTDGWPNYLLHNQHFFYDGAGREIEASEVAPGVTDTSVTHYSALGALAHTIIVPASGYPATTNEEAYITDAFGNVKETWPTIASGGPASQDSANSSLLKFYSAATGRLDSAELVGIGGGVHGEVYAYDSAGNRRVANLAFAGAGSTQEESEVTFYYYDAAERLRVLDKQSCWWDPSIHTCATSQSNQSLSVESTFDEYFYDALGRRVMVRSRNDKFPCSAERPYNWPTGCFGTIERTAYDGDQVLYEIRMPGDDSVSAGRLERDTGGVATYYSGYLTAQFGRIVYTHGETLDEPLDLISMGFSATWPGPIAIVPFANLRHAYDLGAFLNGTYGQGSQYLCTNYGLLPLSGDTTCVNIHWPASFYGAFLQDQGLQLVAPFTWVGSLVDSHRDGSNQLYKRNRYFDPQTQTFTQEDPIRLAGGVNLYGFAGGDPINFDDPFGLCPVTADNPTPCSTTFAIAGGAAGAALALVPATVTTVGTLGLGAPVGAAEVATGGALGFLGGAAIGATVDLAVDLSNKAPAVAGTIAVAYDRLAIRLRAILTGLLIGEAHGLKAKQNLGRTGSKPATETVTEVKPKSSAGSDPPDNNASGSPGGTQPEPQSP